jgi:O-antigen/teichoic acid export membrane protein
MIQIYNVSDVLLLGYLAGSHSVGLYTAANRLPASIVTFANLWLQAFFPQAAARLQDDPAAFRRDLAATLSGAIILAVVIAGGAAVIAPQLMRALFGGAFRGSATPFVVLAAAMSLVLIEAVLSNVLIAGGKDRTYAAVVTVAAGVNVALNFVLIPSMHATGSALATLVTESLLVGMTLTLGIAGLGAPTMAWGRIARGVASAAAMCAAMWLVVGVASVWLSILTGVCVLTCMVLLTQPFDPRLWSGRSENSGLPRG